MKTLAAHLLIVLVLVGAAEALRRAATIEERIATTQEQLITAGVTTQVADADLDASVAFTARVPLLGPRLERQVARQRAVAAYWRGDYALLTPMAATPAGDESVDPALRFLAANAVYRTALRAPRTTNQALARRLDDVLKGYAAVLEDDPAMADAAYNYEYVTRLRAALAANRTAAPAPRTPNMQGEKGEPPQGSKQSDFNVIVPLRPEERQEQLDPGAGAEFKRKG